MKQFEKIKGWVKAHKEELLIGAGSVVVSAGVGYVVLTCATKSFPWKAVPKNDDVDLLIEIIDCLDSLKGDSKMYLPAIEQDVLKIFQGKEPIVRDPSGKLLKVSSAILFGNVVE